MSNTPPTRPIPISTSHSRARSASMSSEEGSNPGLSPSNNSAFPSPQLDRKPLTPASPILSYFFGAKDLPGAKPPPLATGAKTLPKLPAVIDDDELEARPPTPGTPGSPLMGHHRAFSSGAAGWSRFPATGTGTNPPMNSPETARGTGVLRRLSLSGTFAKPTIPPSATTPVTTTSSASEAFNTAEFGRSRPMISRGAFQKRTPGRRATIGAAEGRMMAPRAPSPMGERMLRGHFDGFN